jgi:hypothetical protein
MITLNSLKLTFLRQSLNVRASMTGVAINPGSTQTQPERDVLSVEARGSSVKRLMVSRTAIIVIFIGRRRPWVAGEL